jgi:hypothetical protein
MGIIYSKCVFVAFVIESETRMRNIFIFDLSGSTILFHVIL